jgi:hypothetical protein
MNCRECGAELNECAECHMTSCSRPICHTDLLILREEWRNQ